MKINRATWFLLGASALVATGLPLINARAQESAKPKAKPKIEALNGDEDTFPAPKSTERMMRRFFDGLDLTPEQKKSLDESLRQFEKSQGQGNGPHQFKWEFRSDGKPQKSAPNKAEKQDEDSTDEDENPGPGGAGDLGGMMQQLMKQLQGSGFEDLFGPGGPGGGGLGGLRERSTGPQQLQRLLGEAQGKRSSKYEKGHRRVLSEFRPVVKAARESTVAVYADGESAALATIVTADGYALTKLSAVKKGDLECEFSDGATVKAKVVDKLKDYDLALIKLEAKDLKPVEFTSEDDLPVGTVLTAAGTDEDPVAVGVVSVLTRSLDSRQKGFLGVRMDAGEGGVKVTMVSEGTAAAKAGLKVDDVITTVDGKAVATPADLTGLIVHKKPGEEVNLTYRRGNDDKGVIVTLGSRADAGSDTPGGLNEDQIRRMQRRADQTANMGMTTFDPADNLPKALQNDLAIAADQCGGPVVDLDGHVVGINISRTERTKTFAIPGSTVRTILKNVAEGKLNEPKEKADFKRELKDAESARAAKLKELEELEAKLKAAREALDKVGN